MNGNSTDMNLSLEEWDEVTVSPILFGIVCSLSAAGMCLALFFMTFNIKHRRNRIVKMSSPNLNVIMQLGAISLYACPVLFGIEGVGSGSDTLLTGFCQARVWCLTIGFTLVYGTIFSKSWRVHTIFKSASVKRTVFLRFIINFVHHQSVLFFFKLLFLKLKAWKENPQANLSRAITASYLACSGNASFNKIEEELFLLSAENVALKKSLSEKDETIKTMQEHVQNAREKLEQLQVDGDARQDSGCDVDMSSSSTGNDDVDISRDTALDETGTMTLGNSVLYQTGPVLAVNGLDLHQLTRTESLDRFSNVRKRPPRDRNSLRSINSCLTATSTNNFADLKDSIAKNLHVAHTLSSTLRSSIADELNSCRKRPMYHEIADTERDIAHAFQQSYNFDNADVLSVISNGSVFTYDNPVFMRGSDFRLSGSSYYTGRTSRHSSFRSIASFASDLTDRSRASSFSRKLKWPRYIPPQQDHLIPPPTHDLPRVVKIEMVRSTGKMNSTYV
ncbi:uncharacterized protein LOC117119131 [Anneissia japonica]|uniref:uncharacterized protein LOC117119131 n=1 Tax=Anneissia japonica TaxID=1529436 RepID=UPI001425A517|nr:uncharacterized protein LOC117119131 [Anneissia japonica]